MRASGRCGRPLAEGVALGTAVEELTPEQAARVERIAAQGVPREEALAIVTERWLDPIPIGGSGPAEEVPPLLDA